MGQVKEENQVLGWSKQHYVSSCIKLQSKLILMIFDIDNVTDWYSAIRYSDSWHTVKVACKVFGMCVESISYQNIFEV